MAASYYRSHQRRLRPRRGLTRSRRPPGTKITEKPLTPAQPWNFQWKPTYKRNFDEVRVEPQLGGIFRRNRLKLNSHCVTVTVNVTGSGGIESSGGFTYPLTMESSNSVQDQEEYSLATEDVSMERDDVRGPFKKQ
eukprot:GHVU01143928.1.p1 GENE.GHVU01143928.1~~GHVU01143928.1.p1  ORF type:complete len:136 (+),score=12.43 GHVU01143928.1:418-825(+)